MKDNRIRRSRSKWQKLIQQHAVSRLSVTSFCKEQGISVSSLYYWRKKLAPTAEPIELEPGATNQFIELGKARQSFDSWDIELELGGMVLRVRQA